MRDKKKLIGLSRAPVVNQLQAVKESITKAPPLYNMDGLVIQNKLTWLLKNLGTLGNCRFKPYPTYDPQSGNNGIFKIPKDSQETTSVALLSDWASDTVESQCIAAQAGTNDYSIHLGDTYYVGNEKEIAYNFNTDQGGTWPYGSLGSFAMLGNHEMYSSGKVYFTQLLPYMGNYEPGQDNVVQTQKASFFCLENDYWRIIGLDTGYDSLKGFFGLTNNTGL